MEEKIRQYIATWQERCYPELPEESPSEIYDKVPSYQRICAAILKNDRALQSLGFSRPPCEVYSLLKRKELEKRKEETGTTKRSPRTKVAG